MSVRDQIVNEIHKPARRKFARRPMRVVGISDLMQVDLMDCNNLKKHNDGYRYVLVAINCFTKKTFLEKVKTKTSKDVSIAFKKILSRIKFKPRLISSDFGGEFKGEFTALLKKQNIRQYFLHSDLKAVFAERVIRTLRSRLSKDMALRGSLRYIDHLQSVVDGYNNTVHSKTLMKPNEVLKKDEKSLLNSVFKYERPLVQKTKYKIGDQVRLSTPKHVFSRGYWPSWSLNLFEIIAVNPKYPTTYKVVEAHSKDPVLGTFYNEELLKTANTDSYIVEKILKRNKKTGKVLIKWEGFTEKDATWEDAANIEEPKK